MTPRNRIFSYYRVYNPNFGVPSVPKEQQLHDFNVALASCHHQGSVAMRVTHVNVRASFDLIGNA